VGHVEPAVAEQAGPAQQTGKVVGEIPRAPENQNGSPNQPAAIPPRTPGRGGQGPVAGFLPNPNAGRGGGRGNVDPAEQTARILVVLPEFERRSQSQLKCAIAKRGGAGTPGRRMRVDDDDDDIEPDELPGPQEPRLAPPKRALGPPSR
jgi:hypothetical protein